VSEQQSEQSGAEESGGQSAEQSAAEKTGSRGACDEKVRRPRLPPEKPPPARAFASDATRTSAVAIAASAISKR
jgi:hypothetical protein